MLSLGNSQPKGYTFKFWVTLVNVFDLYNKVDKCNRIQLVKLIICIQIVTIVLPLKYSQDNIHYN